MNSMNTDSISITSLIQIDDQTLGKFVISIEDIQKPQWHGTLQTIGRLSIYHAVKSGESLIPCYGMIYVLSTENDPEAHDVGFAMFSGFVPVANAVGQLIHMVQDVVALKAMKVSQEAAAHGKLH